MSLSNRINRIEPSATMAVSAEAGRLRAAGVDIVDFSAGEPRFATPQHIKDAAIAALNANFTKYTAVPGIVELRDAIVQRHALDFGSDYKREEAMASTGGKHALFNAFQVLVEHGDEVLDRSKIEEEKAREYAMSKFTALVKRDGDKPVALDINQIVEEMAKKYDVAPDIVEDLINEIDAQREVVETGAA
jgi:histidinol-phosphate/aromatic aminotransferase/cobyric acid decarboxylase-like protein